MEIGRICTHFLTPYLHIVLDSHFVPCTCSWTYYLKWRTSTFSLVAFEYDSALDFLPNFHAWKSRKTVQLWNTSPMSHFARFPSMEIGRICTHFLTPYLHIIWDSYFVRCTCSYTYDLKWRTSTLGNQAKLWPMKVTHTIFLIHTSFYG